MGARHLRECGPEQRPRDSGGRQTGARTLGRQCHVQASLFPRPDLVCCWWQISQAALGGQELSCLSRVGTWEPRTRGKRTKVGRGVWPGTAGQRGPHVTFAPSGFSLSCHYRLSQWISCYFQQGLCQCRLYFEIQMVFPLVLVIKTSIFRQRGK